MIYSESSIVILKNIFSHSAYCITPSILCIFIKVIDNKLISECRVLLLKMQHKFLFIYKSKSHGNIYLNNTVSYVTKEIIILLFSTWYRISKSLYTLWHSITFIVLSIIDFSSVSSLILFIAVFIASQRSLHLSCVSLLMIVHLFSYSSFVIP